MSTTITKVTDITTIDSGTLAALTPLELKSLTTIQLGALTADQLSGLSATLVSMLPLKYIPAAALKGISTTAIEGLAVKFLSVAQIAELSAPQIAKLTTKQMLALQPAQFNALTSVGALSADQLGALKATVFKGLTPDSISHMTTDTAAALTITQLSKLTTVDGGQLEAFTPTQVAHFLTDAITWLHNHNFSTISGTATIGSGIETSKIVESSKIVAISAPLSIAGGNGADSITGSTGTDVITGGLGNDTITGGAGADTITGGAGNDVYKYNAGDSIVGSVDLLIGSFDGYSADLVKLNDIVGTLSLLPSQSISALSEADFNTLLNSTNGTGTHFKGGNNTSIAQLTDGTSKYWAIDLNGDGSFTGGTDLLINVTDSTTLTSVTVETFGVRLPTLSTISTVTDAIEDTEKEISFANLMALADEADVDGTVTAFVVKSVASGTLKIGGNPWVAGNNDVINSANIAFWTPAANANGELSAFSVVAKDNGGYESLTHVSVQVAVAAVNDAPVLTTTALTISEGGTVTLTSNNLAATDVEGDALTFNVSGIIGGIFKQNDGGGNGATAISSFTNAQIASGAIRFVHDGTETAAAFDVTVGDGTLTTTPPISATITYTGVNDQTPILTANALTVTEGQTEVLSASNFAATDADLNSDQTTLTFAVSAITGGAFQLVSNSSVVTSFTNTQIANGAIRFVHDGNELPAAFSTQVSDGTNESSVATAAIIYTSVNDIPTLTTISTSALTGVEDTEKMISFTELQTAGNAADVDGTVTGFVVRTVLTGTLKIGATSSEATAFDASTNATIDATHFAYWIPAANANGTLNAFSVVAKDNSDAVSASAIPVQVAVTPVEDEATGSLSISGTAQVGNTLASSFSPSDPDGAIIGINYGWFLNSNLVSASSYYAPTAAGSLYVQATTTDALGGTTLFTSGAVSIAAPVPQTLVAQFGGRIGGAGATEVFNVYLVANHAYIINEKGSTYGYGSLRDPYLRLNNSSGSQIAANDDYGSLDSQISFTPSESGYYLIVAGAFSANTGTYTVLVFG